MSDPGEHLLPPPSLPLSTSQFAAPSEAASQMKKRKLFGAAAEVQDEKRLGTMDEFDTWMVRQQRKLFRLGSQRRAQIATIPTAEDVFLHTPKNNNDNQDDTINDQNDNEMINSQQLDGSFEEAVWRLLRRMLPDWSACQNLRFLSVAPLSAAMTNSIFVCSYDDTNDRNNNIDNNDNNDTNDVKCVPRKVLLRIYGVGTESFFSRTHELHLLQVLSSLHVTPRILGLFQNGRIEEYLDAYTLNSDDLRSHAPAIAEALFSVHALTGLMPMQSNDNDGTHHYRCNNYHTHCNDSHTNINGHGNFSSTSNRSNSSTSVNASSPDSPSEVVPVHAELWERLWNWFDAAKHALAKLKTEKRHSHYHARLNEINLDVVLDDLKRVQLHAVDIASPVIFAHNDTQYGNILRRSSDKSIVLIDFEYAGYSYRGFDIANHFCEWMADYHSSTPHLLDPARYPTAQQQRQFLESYLNARDKYIQSRIASSSSSPSISPAVSFSMSAPPMSSPHLSPRPSPYLMPHELAQLRKKELAHLMEEVAYFKCLSHAMWFLWGLVQARQSVIEFDYVGYALCRLDMYWADRDAFKKEKE